MTTPPVSSGPVPETCETSEGSYIGATKRLLPGSNWGMTDLQSVAFPLGEGAVVDTDVIGASWPKLECDRPTFFQARVDPPNPNHVAT